MNNEINIIVSDPFVIYEDGKKIYKELTGQDIKPSSEDNLILATVSALLGNVSTEMNEVAKQNYLNFAKGIRLDLKGEFYGERGARLEANAARTTMRCYISELVERDVIIRKGTRFIHVENIFFSVEENKITQGNISIDVIAECENTGDIGKILPGEITEIVDKYDYYENVVNITAVTGGRDEETDEAYAERIANIPEGLSTAGPEGAYKALTHEASSLVYDVVIDSPIPNEIDIYVVGQQELLSTEEKEKIMTYLSDINKRPLNDKIEILDTDVENYDLKVTYYLYKNYSQNIEDLEIEFRKALIQLTRSLKIGELLNEQDVIAEAKLLGIKRIEVEGINETIDDITLSVCDDIELTFGGSD